MKKTVLLGLIMFANECHAIFGIDALHKTVNENNQTTQTIAEQNKKIFEDVIGIKDNQVTMKAFSDFKNEMTFTLQSEIRNEMKAVGVDLSKTIKQDISAGRDAITQTQTNDTSLMKKIIYVMGGVIASLIAILSAVVTKLFNLIEYRNNLKQSNKLYKTKLGIEEAA